MKNINTILKTVSITSLVIAGIITIGCIWEILNYNETILKLTITLFLVGLISGVITQILQKDRKKR